MHYVYALVDEKGNPFYIGKGQNDRCHQHLHKSHNHLVNMEISSIRKRGYEPEAIKLMFTNDEMVALETEEFLIRQYGMKKDGGVLCNLTDECVKPVRYWAGKTTAVAKPIYHKGFIFPSRKKACAVTNTPVTTMAKAIARGESVYLDSPYFAQICEDPSLYEENLRAFHAKRHPNAKKICVDGAIFDSRDDSIEQTKYSKYYIKKAVKDPSITNIYYIDT